MRGELCVTGMVLSAAPHNEYGRRVVILTKERGKITAFARGAGRPTSALGAASRPFAFGTFTVREGRNAYTLLEASSSADFSGLSKDMALLCMGSYFLEVAAYVSRENMDAGDLLILLYQSLRALLHASIPNRLVRRVFELKTMQLNGEYDEKPPVRVSAACAYAWEFVLKSPPASLYKFTLTKEVLSEFEDAVEQSWSHFIKHPFKSLEIAQLMV